MRRWALVFCLGMALTCVVGGCATEDFNRCEDGEATAEECATACEAEDSPPAWCDEYLDGGPTDAEPTDAGDGGTDPGPCGSCEDGQVCDTEAEPPACVDCVDDMDCDGDTPVCDTATNTCVGCLENADCTDPTASLCDTTEQTCIPCTGPGDCSHLDGLGVCDDSGEPAECVECTPATEEDDCGAKSCDPETRECGPHDRDSREPCQSCVSDSDCEDNYRCVPMDLMGEAREQAYCLQIAPSEAGDPTCTEPYIEETPVRTSLSGVGGDTYCGINEDLAACEAVYALENNWRCDGTDGTCKPADGEPSVEVPSSLCRSVGVVGLRCTYECGVVAECPGSGPGASCDDEGSSDESYCGG